MSFIMLVSLVPLQEFPEEFKAKRYSNAKSDWKQKTACPLHKTKVMQALIVYN